MEKRRSFPLKATSWCYVSRAAKSCASTENSGRLEVADLSLPQFDDLLDDLSELVQKMGGKVLVIPADQMPGRTELAAT